MRAMVEIPPQKSAIDVFTQPRPYAAAAAAQLSRVNLSRILQMASTTYVHAQGHRGILMPYSECQASYEDKLDS